MRLAFPMAVLVVATTLFAAPAPKLSTAVFTLDAEHHEFLETQSDSLEDQLRRWASACRIAPGGGLAVLECRSFIEPLGASTAQSSEKTPATMALFRDLEETIYLAACPFVEEDPAQGAAEGSTGRAANELEPQDLRNCRDVEAGQTFSTEVEDGLLRIVVRGRQLTFRVFEVREKPETVSDYTPTPAGGLPRVGPNTTKVPQGMEPQDKPRWEPPQPASASAGSPAQTNSRGVEPARTSLRTGRVTIQCPSREAVVLIDGTYMGTCPMTTTLVAGPHTLTVQQPGQAEQVREVRVEGGKTLRWRVKNE
jgi:hypothetical protein